MKFIIDRIDFGTGENFLSSTNLDRQLLLLRIVSVVLAQCNSRYQPVSSQSQSSVATSTERPEESHEESVLEKVCSL